MESADDGFLVLDKHLNIVKANQTWLRNADLDKEVIGKNILELFPSLRETERYSGYLRVLETGESVEFSRVPDIVGTGLVYNITAFKVGDGLGVISRDITELVKNEENMENLLENLPDPLTVNDGESFILVNHALAKLLGYDKPSELTGKPIISIFPPENRETIQKRTRARLRGEQLPPRYELKLYSKEGTRIDVEVNLSIIKYMGKNVILAVFRDIRERKQILERLSGFIENATDAYSILDEDMHYLMVNETELEYSGLDREDYIGKHLLKVFPQLAETGRYEGYLKVLETGEPVEYPQVISLMDEERRLHFKAFKAGNMLGIVGRNVTETIKKEEKLERANQIYQTFNKGFMQILRNDSFEKTARTLFNDLTELIDAKSGYVALLNEDGSENEVLFLESGGLPCTVNPDLPMPIRGLREKAYESGKGVYENDFHESEWQKYLPEGHVKLNNVLFAPLNIDKKTVGIIGIANKSTDFTDEDVELADSFGELAAIALKHTRFLEDLQESRERLSGFMESAADGFVLLDEDLNVQLVNQVWLDQAGLKKERVVNRHIADIFPYIIEAGRLDIYKEVQNTGESREIHQCDHPGGKETWFNIRVFKVGEGLGLITRDVTKEVKYRQQLETLHKHTVILQNADNEAEIIEQTYHILVESLGYETVDIIKCEDGKLIDLHTTTPERYEIPVTGAGITSRAFRLAESQLVQDTSKDPDYIPGPIETRNLSELVVPILVEEEVKFLINIETKKLYSLTVEDKKLVELLAGHVGSQLASLKLESERIRANLAEEMEEMKSRFMRTATHELRTPLTSMKGFLDLALAEKDLNNAREYLRVAARNTERLEALTNDLLDQQRIEDGRLDLDRGRLELVQLVEVAVDEVRPILDERGQRLELKSPSDKVFVYADQLRLIQVLVNLLDNASKYSPDGSLIKVMVLVDGDWVCVSVVDEGYGLTGEDIEKLFMPFPDIDRPTVTEQSVGLGLSICEGIIDMHGGEIWAESPGLGEGSTFVFKLPRREKR